MIAAGVWTGVGCSNLKNCRIRIQKSWNRSGAGIWKSDSGHLCWPAEARNSEMTIGLDLDWIRPTENFVEFRLHPGCESLQNLGCGRDLDWVNGKEMRHFCLKRLQFSRFLDYISTWTLHLKIFLGCGWTWTEFFKIWTGSRSENMTIRSSLVWTGFVDFLDTDSCCLQRDQEWGFPCCSRSRTGFGFCLCWKNVASCLLDLYLPEVSGYWFFNSWSIYDNFFQCPCPILIRKFLKFSIRYQFVSDCGNGWIQNKQAVVIAH